MVLCRVVLVSSSYYCDVFFFQAEDGIRDLVRSRGLGDVYKRQSHAIPLAGDLRELAESLEVDGDGGDCAIRERYAACLLYTSDAADERSSVDLGGRRIIKKKTHDSTRQM